MSAPYFHNEKQTLRRYKKEIVFVCTLIAVSKGILFFISWMYRNLSNALLGGSRVEAYHFPPLASLWSHMDTGYFVAIAVQGYTGDGRLAAFFPLYPALIRIVSVVTHDPYVSAFLVSNLASVVAFVYLYRLTKYELGSHIAERSLLYFAVYPLAFFLCASYSESVFLALSIPAFFYARKGRWWIASGLGFFAVLSRLVGIALFLIFIYEYLSQKGVLNGLTLQRENVHKISWDAVSLALMPCGLVVVMLISWLAFQNPLQFALAERFWNRSLTWPWVTFGNDLAQLSTTLVVEYLLFIMVIAIAIYGLRKIQPSYLLYTWVSLLIPVVSGSMTSSMRYVFVIFPIYMILGIAGYRHKNVETTILVAFPVLLGYFTYIYVSGQWIA